jgi:hypothetical protein
VTQDQWIDFGTHLAKIRSWFLKEETAIIKKIMQQGIDTGELHIERLDLSAHITCISLQVMELPWALEAHAVTPEDYADMMIDMMYNGIRKR